MADQKTHQVAAVVAAYNEAERIGDVLRVLTSYPGFNEVVVVDDGSSDNTSAIVQKFPVRLIRHEQNTGKGRAMDDGVSSTQADIIFFCDADVRGLTHEIIRDTLAPVLADKTDMMIAMRNRNVYWLSFILAIIPLLGGERALTRELWEKTPAKYKHRFMIEAGLNFYARYYGRGFYYKAFPGLTQTIKEKKYGVWKGFKGRVRMFYEVVKAEVLLQLNDAPPAWKSGRMAVTNIAAAGIGIAIGGLFIFAAQVGPVTFVRQLFADRLQTDPSTPIINTLISIASHASVISLVAFGTSIICLNLLVIAINFKNVRHLLHGPQPKRRLP